MKPLELNQASIDNVIYSADQILRKHTRHLVQQNSGELKKHAKQVNGIRVDLLNSVKEAVKGGKGNIDETLREAVEELNEHKTGEVLCGVFEQNVYSEIYM